MPNAYSPPAVPFLKEFLMRRWYFSVSAVLSLGLIVALSPFLLSQGDPKADPKKADNAQASKIAKSKIAKVTVYPNSALVTREVEVPDGEGLVELVVSPMPDQIVPSTMYSEGSDGIRILTTRFRTRQVLEDTSEERRKLETDMEKLMVNGSKIDSEIVTCQKNIDLLTKLENFTDKSAVLSTEKGGLNGDAVITMAKYVMEQRTEKAKDLVAVKEQKRLNDIQMEFCKRKMGELGAGSGRQERDAVVVVDREAGKGGKVRLNYLVGAVTWRPEYKLRGGKVTEEVQINYLANLKQHSGEDWNQVELTLSTAQPMLNAAPPELAILEPTLVARGAPGGPPMGGAGGMAQSPYANAEAPDVLKKKARAGRDEADRLNAGQGALGLSVAKTQKDADKLLNRASAWEQNLELTSSREEILAQLKKKTMADTSRTDGPSVSFHLNSRLTVPSRNDEQIIEVVRLALLPKYYYKTVPVLNRHVYRLADLVNKSDYILLPGEATMYQGSDFVGRMPMPLVAIGEEFTAGFGVDTQLQIQRQMVDQTRTTQGGNQVLKYDYRILVSSFKSEPVKLQVWDRLPKGETERINISLIKSTPALSKDGIYQRESRPNNLLRWDLEVPANRNGENAVPITYEFSMELDRQMAITGFLSR
jgi:hypothetical protein